MNKSHLELFVLAAVLILIVGFIAGISFGNTIPRMIGEEYDYSSFNTLLMFEIWGSSVLISIFVFGIYSIAKRLDVLIKINPEYKNEIKKEKKNKNNNIALKKKSSSKKDGSEYDW